MEITQITQLNIDYFKPVIPPTFIPRANLMLGAVEEGVPCGVLLAQVINEEAELLWLFVTEESRRQGCATLLLDTFTNLIDELGVEISYFTMNETEKTEDMVAFLAGTGYVRELPDAGECLTFALRDVDRSIFLAPSSKTGIVPLAEAESYCIRGVEKLLAEEFGVRMQPVDREQWKNSELSFVRQAEKQVSSFLLARLIGEELYVDYLYDGTGNPKYSMGLIARFLIRTDDFFLSPKTKVHVIVTSGDMKRMLSKMTDGKLKEIGTLTAWTRRV